MVGDVLGRGVGLPGLEQHRVGIDRFPVHRHSQQQVHCARDLAEAGEQVIEQHVVGGESDGFGEGGIQASAGGQPPLAIGAAEAAADRLVEPAR